MCGKHALDPRLAEDPTSELDGMAAHVEQHAAAGAIDVPEPSVRTFGSCGPKEHSAISGQPITLAEC
jgi:hypothetical protein